LIKWVCSLLLVVGAIMWFGPRHLDENPHHNPVARLISYAQGASTERARRVCDPLTDMGHEHCDLDQMTRQEGLNTAVMMSARP